MSRYKVYTRPPITELLRQVETMEQGQAFYLEACQKLKPTASTKRKWRMALGTRVEELKIQSLLHPELPKAGGLLGPDGKPVAA